MKKTKPSKKNQKIVQEEKKIKITQKRRQQGHKQKY